MFFTLQFSSAWLSLYRLDLSEVLKLKASTGKMYIGLIGHFVGLSLQCRETLISESICIQCGCIYIHNNFLPVGIRTAGYFYGQPTHMFTKIDMYRRNPTNLPGPTHVRYGRPAEGYYTQKYPGKRGV